MLGDADEPLLAKDFIVCNVVDQLFEYVSYLIINLLGGLCPLEILIKLTFKLLCLHKKRTEVHLFKKIVSFGGFEVLHL